MKAIGYLNSANVRVNRNQYYEVEAEIRFNWAEGQKAQLADVTFAFVASDTAVVQKYNTIGTRIAVTIEVLDG